MFNSGPQADTTSSLLEHQGVISIEEKKAIRRANVALLLDEHGQTRLADLTEIAPALLYQMAKGRGKSKRQVNDRYARLIEDKLGLADGWMDVDHSGKAPQAEPRRAAKSAPDKWPFSVPRWRYDRLEPDQKQWIDEEVKGLIQRFEERNRPKTKSRAARNA